MNALIELYSFPIPMLIAFFGASLFLMLASGSPLIAWLKGLKGMKWSPREDTPDSHLQKAGVPSMGGIGIIGSALVGYIAVMLFMALTEHVLFRNTVAGTVSGVVVFLLLPVTVGGHALLGFIDDWSKARGKGGLLARQKLLGQIVLAAAFLGAFSWYLIQIGNNLGANQGVHNLIWLPLLFLIVIGTSNAVNLTDGIDGLAAGLSLECAVAFLILALSEERAPYYHAYAGLPAVFFWLCIGGACLGFLAFNKNPAKVFMGDTGSLALGAALGAGAILTGSVLLLPFIGFIFFVEMFSVISQVAYFKYTKKKFGEGKRIFRRAPLHHHYELGGWREWRVVGTFWAINAITTIIGLLLWKAGIIPRFP